MSSASSYQSRAPESNLIFACSGASDTGCICDQTARALVATDFGQMGCTMAAALGDAETLRKIKAAHRVVAISGCCKDCACKALEQAGASEYTHLTLDMFGMQKGKCPPTPEKVKSVVQEVKFYLTD